jgi:hypothetical protein
MSSRNVANQPFPLLYLRMTVILLPLGPHCCYLMEPEEHLAISKPFNLRDN